MNHTMSHAPWPAGYAEMSHISAMSALDTPYRVAKTHRMPYLCMSFPQKNHMISGSFAERGLQLKASYASLPPCSSRASTYTCICVYINVLRCVAVCCTVKCDSNVLVNDESGPCYRVSKTHRMPQVAGQFSQNGH